MIADWSVEAGAESPRIVVPWAGWLDLRGGVEHAIGLGPDVPARAPEFSRVAEAREYPELLPLLRLANLAPTMSSKVDVFAVTAAEADPELAELDEASVRCGLGSYLDLILPESSVEFAAAERAARQMAASLREIAMAEPACAEVVVRPAMLWERPGWGWSVYAMGFGPEPAAARVAWSEAASLTLEVARRVLGAAQW